MAEMTIRQALDLALQHHRAGRLAQSEQIYRQILSARPNQHDALHLLGVLATQTGHAAAAVDLIGRAVAGQPHNADMQSNLGNALVKAGRQQEAVAAYQKALELDAGHAGALANLGPALQNLERWDEAVDTYRRLAERSPAHAAEIQFGTVLRKAGRYAESASAFGRATALDPSDASAHVGLSAALFHMGRLEESIASCTRALDLAPALAEAHANFGAALRVKGAVDESIEAQKRAIRLKPELADAHSNHALALKDKGLWDEALAAIDRAVRLAPNRADFHCNRGATLLAAGRPDDAEAACRQAIALAPALAQAHSNLGAVLREQRRPGEAVEAQREAIRLEPGLAEAHCQLGVALKDLGDLGGAVAATRRATELTPDYARAWANLGATLHDAGDLSGATAAYRRAIEIDPGHADAHTGLGIALLTIGDFAAGWEEYEWRGGATYANAGGRNFSQPKWDGHPLEGRTVLLHAEQGLGDTIQFSRYLSTVARQGGKIVLECQPELLRLLTPLAEAVGGRALAKGQPHPQFDLHCPLLGLPRLFKSSPENLPREVPYLRAEQKDVDAWAGKLDELKGRAANATIDVGLVWAGSRQHKNDRNRSIPLARLGTLAEIPNVRWVSLQRAAIPPQVPVPPNGMHLFDHTAELTDMADTAALLANLDLVIGVDTAVVHLAGAMGRPVWTLLPYRPDWRWMLGRDDSLWYPTMRLFRQPAFGDWDAVIERVGAALRLFEK